MSEINIDIQLIKPGDLPFLKWAFTPSEPLPSLTSLCPLMEETHVF